jgi:DNA repair protein RadA/Sms
MYTEDFESAPGSVGQVRDCAAKMMFYAKRNAVPVFLIGHVTKEGAIAGPRVLEHIVDTVLYFEGDRGHPYRILRAVKNRFGSTNEIGVFEMSDAGLKEVENPSELFLSERPQGVAGSLLVAVLEKLAGLQLGGMDIFTNVVGGLKLAEPAVDLAVVLALASSLKELPVGPEVLAFGEVGLSGEIRAVSQTELRLREAAKIGFKRAIIPKGSASRLNDNFGLEIIPVGSVSEALEAAGL